MRHGSVQCLSFVGTFLLTITSITLLDPVKACGEPLSAAPFLSSGTGSHSPIPRALASTTRASAPKISTVVPNQLTPSTGSFARSMLSPVVVIELYVPASSFPESEAYAVQGGVQVGRAGIGPASGYGGMWSGSADSWVKLHPPQANFSNSFSAAYGVYGNQQVGQTSSPWWGTPRYRASLWTGTPASWVDLNPAGSTYSVAWAVYDGQQVGEADVPFTQAGLWTGTAASWVSLHPDVAEWSEAFGVYGNQQVGRAGIGGQNHASLWTGTASSWVDLNPAGSTGSSAHGVYEGRQVGDAWVRIGADSIECASLWTNGTPESWVNLNPTGSTASMAAGIFGNWQVGTTRINGVDHAGVWSGSAASWVDLQTFLPVFYDGSSNAYGIWGDGSFIYVVGAAYHELRGRPSGVMWVFPDSALTTGVDNTLLGTTLALHVAPNPVTDASRITFALPQPSDVDMCVYDVNGRRVATVATGTFLAGRHGASWNLRADNGARVSSGVYFLELRSESERLTKRLLVLK